MQTLSSRRSRVWDAAKNALPNSHNAVFDAKRLIGRKMDDPDIQRNVKHWPFKVKEGIRKCFCRCSLKIHLPLDLQTPEEISAVVLDKMKETAEAYLGHKAHALIMVPACKLAIVPHYHQLIIFLDFNED